MGYVVLGIMMDGCKDILGIWNGEYESGKFWLGVPNDLKSRAVLDVYLFCVDGLKGFREAIAAPYIQKHRFGAVSFIKYATAQDLLGIKILNS